MSVDFLTPNDLILIYLTVVLSIWAGLLSCVLVQMMEVRRLLAEMMSSTSETFSPQIKVDWDSPDFLDAGLTENEKLPLPDDEGDFGLTRQSEKRMPVAAGTTSESVSDCGRP